MKKDRGEIKSVLYPYPRLAVFM